MNSKATDRSMTEEIVEELRNISIKLANVGNELVLFPGWHKGFDEPNAPLVREAASAILAAGVSPDEGTSVSQKSVAALLHYVADMME